MTAHYKTSFKHHIALEAEDFDWLTREITHQLGREERRLSRSSSKAQSIEIAKDIDHENRILAALKAFKGE